MTSLSIATRNINGLALNTDDIVTTWSRKNRYLAYFGNTFNWQKHNMPITIYHNYITYYTNHPDNTAHGGAAIVIKSCIKHHQMSCFKTDFLQ